MATTARIIKKWWIFNVEDQVYMLGYGAPKDAATYGEYIKDNYIGLDVYVYIPDQPINYSSGLYCLETILDDITQVRLAFIMTPAPLLLPSAPESLRPTMRDTLLQLLEKKTQQRIDQQII